jgi:hypothetical protein
MVDTIRCWAVAVLFAALAVPVAAQTAIPPAGAPGPRQELAADLGLQYIDALAPLDDFLEAWRGRNAAAGVARVSLAEQKRLGVANLRGWLTGVSSPSNAAFEVSGGRAVSSTRYRFTVKFYYYLTGGGVIQPPAQAVDVTRQSNGSWLVDFVELTGPNVK